MAELQSTTVTPVVEYRDVPGIPGYRVGDDGSVWSCLKLQGRRRATIGDVWRQLSPGRNADGHLSVNLRGKQIFVHRVVLMSFVGPCPSGYEGCHNDGNPSNNRLSNLRWDTRASNIADAINHGVIVRGEGHHRSKLTTEQILEIKSLPSSVSSSSVASRYGVSISAVQRVRAGNTWRHTGGESPRPRAGSGEQNHQSKLTENDVRAIRTEKASGATLKQIAAKYGVSFALVGFIVRRKSWKHVT